MTGSAHGVRPALLIPGLFALATFVVLVALGTWQMQRLAWKNDILARLDARAKAPPVPFPEALAIYSRAPREAEFLRVTLTGTLLHEREVYLYTILSGAFGWNVVTPLQAGSLLVPVVRGVVPPASRSPESRREGQVAGTVQLVGRLRLPELPGVFTPAPDPEQRTWFARDLPAMTPQLMGEDRSGATLAPFFVDLEGPVPPGGLPRPSATLVLPRNNHLGYALTWYGLAGTLVAVFVAFAFEQRRRAQR